MAAMTRSALKTARLPVLLVCLGLVAASCAQSDRAASAYDRGEYGTALSEWRARAQAGEAKAQYNLALLYYRGQGVPKNLDLAVGWALKSANQGYPLAQYTVGIMYSRGEGLEKDDQQAARWIARAARQGLAIAQHDLGSLYGEGRGVPRDDVLAYMWYTLAIAGLEDKDRKFAEDNRALLAAEMTPEDIILAEQKAAAWKKTNE